MSCTTYIPSDAHRSLEETKGGEACLDLVVLRGGLHVVRRDALVAVVNRHNNSNHSPRMDDDQSSVRVDGCHPPHVRNADALTHYPEVSIEHVGSRNLAVMARYQKHFQAAPHERSH